MISRVLGLAGTPEVDLGPGPAQYYVVIGPALNKIH